MVERHPEAIGPLPFSAAAAPDPESSGPASSAAGSKPNTPPHDLDHYNINATPATQKEVYAYYAYYAGNNGIGAAQYANLLFQNLIYQAGFNPNILPLGSSACDVDPTAPCHVFWAGGTKEYSSVVLIATGLAFLSQALVLLGVGSLADYGNWNPWVVRGFSVLCWAFSFGFLGVDKPHQWRAAMALYICTSFTWWASYVFFNAIFPKLAHDLPEIHRAREDLLSGRISKDDYDDQCSMARSKIMNYSWVWNNVGFVICCALSLGALFGVHADESTQQNNWGYSVSTAVVTGFWIVFSIPWFLWEKRRPGPRLPPGENYLTWGYKQTWFTAKQAWQLRQTFFYLSAYFLLGDGTGTLITVVSIAQTQVVQFSATQNTYLIMVQGASAVVGVLAAYWIQARFKIKTKTMLQVTNFSCVVLGLWGTVGIWTTKFGLHNLWEFWLFAAQYGFTLGAQFSYGQAFMSELVPQGREYLFFGLLGIVSKGSGWIGPIVSSAIVASSGNQWCAFPFITALLFVPAVAICFIKVEKSRIECAEYLRKEAKHLRRVESSSGSQTPGRRESLLVHSKNI